MVVVSGRSDILGWWKTCNKRDIRSGAENE
jgi:hypothetical protein